MVPGSCSGVLQPSFEDLCSSKIFLSKDLFHLHLLSIFNLRCNTTSESPLLLRPDMDTVSCLNLVLTCQDVFWSQGDHISDHRAPLAIVPTNAIDVWKSGYWEDVIHKAIQQNRISAFQCKIACLSETNKVILKKEPFCQRRQWQGQSPDCGNFAFHQGAIIHWPIQNPSSAELLNLILPWG